MKHSSERTTYVPENIQRKRLYESAAATRNTQRRLVGSQYGTRPLDSVFAAGAAKTLFNDHDITRFAQQYHDEQYLTIPEGLDIFLALRAPTNRQELALWLHVCLEKQGLIGPFSIYANPLQPTNCSHLDFMSDAFFEEVGDCIVLGNRFGSKCLGKDTPILMYNGEIKMVQDVRVGDLLMGDDSQPRTVLSTGGGVGPLYKVIPHYGDPYVVNDAHILSLKYAQGARVKGRQCGGEIVDTPIEDYLKLGKTHQELLKGYKVPVYSFGEETPYLPIPPYFLGVWLGDGTCASSLGVTTPEPEIIDYLYKVADAYELDIRVSKEKTINIEYCTYFFKNKEYNKGRYRNELKNYIIREGLNKEKFIPDIFKTAPWEDRLWLLAGLLDTDGTTREGGKMTIQSKYKRLAEDIAFVARSIGLSAYVKKTTCVCTNAVGGPKAGTYYRVNIGGDTYIIPMQVARKRTKPREIATNGRRPHDTSLVKLKIEQIGIGEYYGFVIDGNRRFLLGDFTVTHNTLCYSALMFAECLHKPGIEIAHLAAIETQAQNCYNYFLKYTQHPLFTSVLARKPTQSQSDFKNGSKVQILVGTVTGVNSPHPTVANIDEAELMDWRILQEALNMATSNKKSASQTRSYRSATRITSTRKKSTGTMQKIIDEADQRGFKIYQWNVWDTIERCQIPNWAGAKFPVQDEIWGNKLTMVPEACAGCTMMQLDPPRCLGKASKSNGGIVHISDIMQKVKNLDLETWIAQHECARPGTSDLMFAMFDKHKHVINYELLLRELDMNIEYAEFSYEDYYARVPYCPDLPVYAAQDAGFVCPATIFAQLVDDWLIVFHEIKQERIAPSIYIKNFLLPVYEKFNPDLWICDPAGMTLISDMEVSGIQGIVLAENKHDPGIENVRARLGADLLYFDYKCVNCVHDLENYSEESYGNLRKRKTFHFADCIRYLSSEFVYYAQTMDKVYY